MVVVDSAGELGTVIEEVDGKETLKFCEIWPVVTLVVLIFAFFSIFGEHQRLQRGCTSREIRFGELRCYCIGFISKMCTFLRGLDGT